MHCNRQHESYFQKQKAVTNNHQSTFGQSLTHLVMRRRCPYLGVAVCIFFSHCIRLWRRAGTVLLIRISYFLRFLRLWGSRWTLALLPLASWLISHNRMAPFSVAGASTTLAVARLFVGRPMRALGTRPRPTRKVAMTMTMITPFSAPIATVVVSR